MVSGLVTPHYKTLRGQTERNKREREIKKAERIGEEDRETNEAHMSEEKKGRDRMAPRRERQREGGAQGERGRDKSKIPRGRKARGMQIEAERERL